MNQRTSNTRILKRVLTPLTGTKSRRVMIGGRDSLVGATAAVQAKLHRGGTPSFLIVGAQKAGTTFLYRELTRHPQVHAALTKEIHFFDDHYQRGLPWYQGFFATAGSKMVGEATPSYLFHPHAIRRIAEDLPSAKLIVLLRDPVRRAFSQYLHESRLGFEPVPSFEEALALEPERLRGELERMLADERYVSYNHRHYSYVARGLYLDQVRRCHQLVGRDQVLVLRSEDLFQDSSGVLAQVFDFLELTPWAPAALGGNDMAAGEPVQLDRETELGLRDLYRPHNERLLDYLGWTRGWGS
jgi:hypothetical protein